ncbi:MAG: hypothetical protein Q9217_000468 [Psora testacea]
MAFSFGTPSLGGSVAGPNNSQTQKGPDLEEISTEAIGFQSVAGEAKLRLVPSPWPADALPPPTASLLSVASRKGLLAAAGPESVFIASTEAVRQAYSASGDGNVKSFSPQLTLNIGMRLSQVGFSADEEFLVLSAENGGGLAVYQVQSLTQGGTQSAFELSTNGASVRALVPNPTAEKAELFAVVTTNGQLMIANLKARHFLSGAQGQNLKDGVSCASWSTRGKQLVAGLGNGSCFQMTPEGEAKAELPAPSWLEGDHYGMCMCVLHSMHSSYLLVSSISWLENDVFLVAHTPSSFDAGMAPATTYHIITRAKPPEKAILFQKLPEPSPPFGLNRSPPYQFMQRLKDFPPNLTDAIIVSSTASTDIGLVTRSKTPLSSEIAAEKVVNVFTTTIMAEDSRRAQLPLTEELGDTFPVGVALDLSSKEKVKRPLPQEELEESPGPLPALMVLNNEGLLSTWWIVYAESIRQGTTFPGLAMAGGLQSRQPSQAQRQVSPFSASSPPPATAFGQSSFGKPSTPIGTFGGVTSTPAPSTFGYTSTSVPAFGAYSGLGQQKSVWGSSSNNNIGTQPTTPAFGQPSFGSSNPIANITQGTAFGMAGGLGNKRSPWGTPSSGAATGSTGAFGQPSKLGSQTSPFASASTGGVSGSGGSNNSTSPSGGFASFATKSSGFLSATPSSGGAQSVFGKPSTVAPLQRGMDTDSSFGQQQQKDEAPKSVFGGSTGDFQLGSTFKADGTAAKDSQKPAGDVAGSMFDRNFSSTLRDTASFQSKDADMDREDEDEAPIDADNTSHDQKDVKPSALEPAQPKFQFPKTDPPKSGGLFGTQSQSRTTPAEVQSSKPAGFSFGKPTPIAAMPKETPEELEDRPRSLIATSPKVKEEPQSDADDISPLNEEEAQPPEGYGDTDSGLSSRSKTPETPDPEKKKFSNAPLPPESTSKASYAPGDSSNSSKSSDDAPLPPDFVPSKTRLKEVEAPQPEQAKLPSDEEEGALDDEGSGVDVGQDVSPSNSNRSSKNVTGSSFGLPSDRSTAGSLFLSMPEQSEVQRGKSALFGEVGKASAPFFPPPTKPQESPRSPSPVRLNTSDSMRPDNSRSISAPVPFKALSSRQSHPSRLVVPSQPQQYAGELRKQERERLLVEQARKAAEERQELIDDDDVQIRRLLESDVAGSKTIDAFLAHQDYVGNIDKPGIPGQIEKIFRDINSMIDTLGLNARSLTAFVKGHEEQARPVGRTRDDLEDLEDWCLIEVEDLNAIENDLFEQLETNKLQNVPEKLAACRDLLKTLSRLHHRSHDLGRTIDLRKDPLAAELAAQAALSLDQQTQQRELRKAFKHFQKQLAKAEEAMSVLRSQLASAEGQFSKPGSNGKDVLRKPTVEAVQNTIRKMTAMVKKKRDDIDVLEMQMKHLRFSTPPTNGSTEEGNTTVNGPLHDGSEPSSAVTTNQEPPLRMDLNRDGTPHKLPYELSEEEVEQYRAKIRRRMEVNQAVRDVVGKRKVRIRPLE